MNLADIIARDVARYDAGCLAARDEAAANCGLVRDVAYGDDPRHRMDLYVPNGATGSLPIIVFFHGGGFSQGDTAWGAPFAPVALAMPAILAAPTYRRMQDLGDSAPFDDGLAVLSWLRTHAKDYGGDPDALILAGHSAGGALAAEIALNPARQARFGVPASAIRGVVCISSSLNRYALAGTPGGGYALPEGALPMTEDAPLAMLDRFEGMPPPFFVAWGGRERQRERVERASLAVLGRLAERGALYGFEFDEDVDHFDSHLLFVGGPHRWIATLQAWMARALAA